MKITPFLCEIRGQMRQFNKIEQKIQEGKSPKHIKLSRTKTNNKSKIILMNGLWLLNDIKMDKKYLIKYQEDKTKICINLKNGRMFTGVILTIEDNIALFKDKFGVEIPIDLSSISYVELSGGAQNGNSWTDWRTKKFN